MLGLNQTHISHFHPLEVVSRYRDPQFQAGENLSYLVERFNIRVNITYYVPIGCLMLGQRCRRWTSIRPTLSQCLVFPERVHRF